MVKSNIYAYTIMNKKCFYKECPSVWDGIQRSSNITFFPLPNDSRRNTWILHSGNLEIWNHNNDNIENNTELDNKNVDEQSPPTQQLYLCEKHFDEKYLIRCGRGTHRFQLSKTAVPNPINNNRRFHLPSRFTNEIDEASFRDDFINSTDELLNVDNFLVNF